MELSVREIKREASTEKHWRLDQKVKLPQAEVCKETLWLSLQILLVVHTLSNKSPLVVNHSRVAESPQHNRRAYGKYLPWFLLLCWVSLLQESYVHNTSWIMGLALLRCTVNKTLSFTPSAFCVPSTQGPPLTQTKQTICIDMRKGHKF